MPIGLTSYQLRFCPASYLHEDHLPASWRWLHVNVPEWRSLPACNKALLDELALGVEYELPAQLGGLALFPADALACVLRELGAILHGEAIRYCLHAPVLRQVIAVLGEEGYRSLLSRLDLLIGPWPAGWQLPLPAILDSASLEAAGLGFWLTAAGAADPAWARRLALRLPVSNQRPDWSLGEDELPLARALCIKIAKQVTQQCYHLLK